MGVRFRKSINLGGGFRINLSKSGIGYSWGTKGYRISKTARGTTRRTYTIPGTGISYVEESGSRNKNHNNNRTRNQNSMSQPYLPTYNQAIEQAIESADISQFKKAEEGSVSDAIERTIRFNRIGNILLWGLLLVPLNPIFIFVPILGAVLKAAAHSVLRVTLDYSFDL